MAIQDRNLAAGTKLWAKYKGEVHRADVAEIEGEEGLRYRLADGRTFKSPSAAATAITGKAANGWAFWTVGEPADGVGPARTTRTSTSGITPAPKPTSSRRGRRQAKTPPTNGNGQVLPIIERLDEQFECGECGEIFPDAAAASDHFDQVHGTGEQSEAEQSGEPKQSEA